MKEKEVVINKRYGGFGLSHAAIMRYAELKGKKLKAYQTTVKTEALEEVEKPEGLWNLYAEGLDDNGKPIGCFYDREIERDDPDLVKVVRELGSEEASGPCAKLEIVEIPEDVDYYIDDYDGIETVREQHRTWG